MSFKVTDEEGDGPEKPQDDYLLHEGRAGTKTITCKDLLHEFISDYVQRQALDFHQKGKVNERAIDGRTTLGYLGQASIDENWMSGRGKVTSNLTGNAAKTWAARMVEGRPSAKAWPGLTSDVSKTRVANALIDSWHSIHDFDNQLAQAALLVQAHSCIGFKTTWDPNRGPISKGYASLDANGNPIIGPDGLPIMEGVGEPEGEVRWDICTIFEYATDGAENVEDSEWAFFRDTIKPWDAMHMWEQCWIDHGFTPEDAHKEWGFPPSLSDKKQAEMGSDMGSFRAHGNGTEVFELWVRPAARFPKGLLIVFVGGRVTVLRDFPYEHGQLPLSVWKCGEKSGSAFGTTHMDSTLAIQQFLDEMAQIQAKNARDLGAYKTTIPPGFKDNWNAENQELEVTAEQKSIIGWLTPPMVNPLIEGTSDKFQNLFYNVFGIQDILMGAQEPKSGTSGRSLAYMLEMDKLKHSLSARSLNKAVCRQIFQSMKLSQQYVKAPRLVQLVGPDKAVDVAAFVGADLDGLDVRIEQSSAIDRLRQALVEDKQQKAASGQLDPATAAEESETGLDSTLYEDLQRTQIQQQLKLVAAGSPQQPIDQVAPTLAMSEILVALQAPQNQQPTIKGALIQLFQAYLQKAGMGQQQPQQQQQTPPQGGQVEGQGQ